MSLQRLTALRALMASQPTALAAYIIPTADAHNSEYIAAADARREWLTGFTGSAGTAVVTATRALVWTDGRYYTQLAREADPALWTLMKQSLPDTPTMEAWLIKNLIDGALVGIDPHTMTREEWTPLQTALSNANMQLVPVARNLVDEAREQLAQPPPPRPCNPVIPLPLKYTGKSAGEKISDLRKQMEEKKAAALVLTALDDIAYTLNLRGSDIDYNPVFFSYLVVTPAAVVLFWSNGELPPDVVRHLRSEGVEHVAGKPYADIEKYLLNMALELSESGDGKQRVWLPSVASEAVHRAASGGDALKKPLTLISEVSPVQLAKLVKNDVELQGFRDCHVRDGVAVVRFLRWLHAQVDAGRDVSELQAADQLLRFRQEEADFMGPSFETIAGAGENGAIIHYSPSKAGEQRVIRAMDMFLLDSGGQYRDGTTDITRTRHLSAPPAAQRAAFTRVLRGQVALGAALFPQGVKGNVLDSFARKALWDVGLDYAHGTGHGVGHFLNVHEGPAGVSWRPYPHDPGLRPGQVLSNEPGYYEVGEYGIRHEDLVEVVAVTKESSHPRASNLVGDYDGRGVLGFSTLTLVPHQTKCIEVSLLDDFELSYINSYHERVLATLGPILKERGLLEDLEWLRLECAPISRDGTTDITRTRHLSAPPAAQRAAFTRVLRGQVALGAALFPQGVKGNVLDSFARKALWDVGLDYAHGTGHGVGHFLNVHEGPAGVSWRPYPHDPGLRPGQVLSNEPGYYEVGEYGIRHEDLVEVVAVTKESSHPRASNLVGDYDGRGVLGFSTLTLVPHQTKCIEVSLLDDFELSYINSYHERVLATLGPILKERGLLEDLEWLRLECAPISRDGTTDITRTRHLSAPPAAQRAAFTRVLRGQVALGAALFPQGVKGNVLDSFARKALWDVGLDYAHGTGHGVGHFLNVHEGPAGVSWRPYPHDPGLRPGQVLSNEPGYYEVGEYGIRHEDLVEVVAVTKESSHPRASNLVGDYDGRGVLGFSTLTLVPHQTKCIEVSLLDDFELSYINSYHERVLATLGPILKERGLLEDLEWLRLECAPISRS